ncbi:MAG: hypothetical protein J6V99_02750 [Neisseriaceae bacterium]|nr:hypothetical protein [Neisseriaceae bacterium]
MPRISVGYARNDGSFLVGWKPTLRHFIVSGSLKSLLYQYLKIFLSCHSP